MGAGTRSGASHAGGRGTGRAGGPFSRNPLSGRAGGSRAAGASTSSSRHPKGSGGSHDSSRSKRGGRTRSLLGKLAGGRGKRITPASSSGGSGGSKAKNKTRKKSKPSQGVLRSAMTKLFTRSSPAARATHKNAKRNARKKRRKMYRRLWRSFKRRMAGRPLRPGDRWWHRWRIGRGASRAGYGLRWVSRGLRNLLLFLSALFTISLAAWINALRRFGNRVGAFSGAAMRSLSVPFEGVTLDVARFLHEISGVVHPIEPHTVPPALVEPARTTRSLDLSDLGITTNLKPLIEAVREAGRLGGGDAPHALTVYQWHVDLQELATAMADLVQADSQLAAETLPVSGGAHEITSSFGPAFNGLAASIQEGTEGWVLANGTRIERLLDDEANKELWDHTTRPDA